MLAIGTPAPAFSLPDQNGTIHNLEQYKGKKIILYFYPELEVIQAYDVWHEKKMAGRTYMGIVRTTYLIDENGIIIQASDKVKAADNPQQMLNILLEN